MIDQSRGRSHLWDSVPAEATTRMPGLVTAVDTTVQIVSKMGRLSSKHTCSEWKVDWRQMQEARDGKGADKFSSPPPEVPPKNSPWATRPPSAMNRIRSMKRKSAVDLHQRDKLDRTFTHKTNSTNVSSGAQSNATAASNQTSMTSQSIFSGYSAGGFSATSAGSLARKRMGSIREKFARPMTSAGTRTEPQDWSQTRPTTLANASTFSGARSGAKSAVGWEDEARPSSSGGLGGFATPKAKKQGIFRKLMDSAKTGAASARSTIAVGEQRSTSPTKMMGIAGGSALNLVSRKNQSMSNLSFGTDAAREMGLAAGSDNGYIMTRRDVNRSNTPGPSERQERADRCTMLDHPVICPVDELYADRQGDENGEGHPVYTPFQLSNPSFSQVDKGARFITSLPSSINAAALATGYVCRPYRSVVQRLRAIFIWCSERISWEDDGYEQNYHADTIRVIQTKRGSSREVATLVMEMCQAIGVHAEIVQGYLKPPAKTSTSTPSKSPTTSGTPSSSTTNGASSDASLASPTNPKRSQYTLVSNSISEAWYFLARPSEFCWTHIPARNNTNISSRPSVQTPSSPSRAPVHPSSASASAHTPTTHP